ncbi:MAG: carboxypeptidase regulatory-like domain-containing protein [Alphaproteobacteria bacterium]|nr:MAG: carboxypeptidase regulatory-like domain-containing protein [Alphaproteobacteria bacterium]
MADLRVSFPTPCDEKWEGMTPLGCNRVCAQCDKIIHDLSQYELEEAEALLRRDPETCVRARIDADGAIVLKRGSVRRMVIAAGASAGLLASQPAFAGQDRPKGVITGKAFSFGYHTKVIATGPNGEIYRTKVKERGGYTFRHLPPGTYALTFVPDCGDGWTIKEVVVGDGQVIVPQSPDEGGCIIVGKMLIDDSVSPKRV